MVRYGGVLSEYHRRARSLRLAVCAALLVCHASALDRTRVEAVQWAPTAPPRGWSSWNSFQYNVTAALVRTSADAMVSTGLLAAGYECECASAVQCCSWRSRSANFRWPGGWAAGRHSQQQSQ